MEKSALIKPSSTFTLTVPTQHAQMRIDSYLADQFPAYSRTFFSQLIDQDLITLNGLPVTKQSLKLKVADCIGVTFPKQPTQEDTKQAARELPVSIVYEHDHFLIVHKPANLVVHKPDTHSTDLTLVDWLLATYSSLASVGHVGRPGIVHRLDKDTSGLMVVARTSYAHMTFGSMFKDRSMHKTYLAVVHGHPERSGSITLPIGRHPIVRTKMATFKEQDLDNPLNTHPIRTAHTDFTVLEYFDDCSLLQLTLHTGRTHQIRVHCAAIGHPLVGDTVYGKKSHLIDRQALHAQTIAYTFDNQPYSFTHEPPEDFKKLLTTLRAN